MKKLFLLLAAVGVLVAACEPNDGSNENNNGGSTEQPGCGDDGGDKGEDPIFITDVNDDIIVEAGGGTIVVCLSTDLEYIVDIPEEAQSWLSIADTRTIRMEKLTFTVAKNEKDTERSVIVKLLSSDNVELQNLLFIQKGAKAEDEIPADKTQAIKFQDETTRLICVLHWDENEDGELSYEEAAAITDLGGAFKSSSILGFPELKYFASLEKIADQAFYRCASLVKITLPEQITTIGNNAFYGCSNLKKIVIPDSVTSIGQSAFYGCTGELTVNCNIPSASSSSKCAFYNSKFTKVVIGNGVTSIGDYAFDGCSSLTSITIPNSVTEIGICAFDGCSSLTSITIPNSVTEIGMCAFYDCPSLTSVHISDLSAWYKIDFDDSYANPLYYAKNLYLNDVLVTELTIPDSVTSIGMYTFAGCTSLTSITIPNSVTSIGYYAFRGCTGELIINSKALVEIDYTYNYNNYNYPAKSWLNGNQFTKLTIGDNITSIGNYAFYDCSSLISVTIGNGVTSIGNYAFYGCSSLTSITIPNSVTSIGMHTFDGCTSLTSVYCKPTTPPSGDIRMFDDNASGRKIYVPTASVNAYKSASYWSNYASYIKGYDFE